MRLMSVYDEPQAEAILYELLAERPKDNFISHERMPSLDEHRAFIASRPFRFWFLIEAVDVMDQHAARVYVGAIEVTENNEIGVAILKRHQRNGYGGQALNLFMLNYQPLPPIPARRNGHWLANIAWKNWDSKAFFEKCGFRPIQETWKHG